MAAILPGINQALKLKPQKPVLKLTPAQELKLYRFILLQLLMMQASMGHRPQNNKIERILQLYLLLILLMQLQQGVKLAPLPNQTSIMMRPSAPQMSLPPAYEEKSFAPPAPKVSPYNPDGNYQEMIANNNPEHKDLPNPVAPEFSAPPAYNPAATTKPITNYFHTQIALQQLQVMASAPPALEYTPPAISCGA